MSTKSYVVIVGRAWMNPSGHGIEYTSDLQFFGTRQAALNHGHKLCDSDDFNVGTVQNGRLIAFGWDEKDFDPGDSDLDAIAQETFILGRRTA